MNEQPGLSMRALLLSTTKLGLNGRPKGYRSVKLGYTSSSWTEGRFTLESEPSAGPDRNRAGFETPLFRTNVKSIRRKR
jgi:hypothetical protein